MNRRKFICVVGGAAAWPYQGHAQQSAMPVIGHLNGSSASSWSSRLAAFHKGLTEAGYVEGRNLTVEYRWANGQYERLHALAADLVNRRVGVIAATGGTASAIAAKTASTTIPIVFAIGADPIKFGLVTSLSRPNGNVTGVTFLLNTMVPKLIDILHEAMPKAGVIGLLVNPTNANASSDINDAQLAAQTLGHKLLVVKASSESEVSAAFASLLKESVNGLFVDTDPFFTIRQEQIIELANRHKIVTLYTGRHFAESGGLMSYGASIEDGNRQAGLYVGQILKGATPADLPVQQSTKVELVINLKTAKSLGLTMPPTLLARADELIE